MFILAIPELLYPPQDWVIINGGSRWLKPYGWYSKTQKKIWIYPPKWIPKIGELRNYFKVIIRNHEVLHSWGNSGCDKIWCLGYEKKDKWYEYFAMPIQFLGDLRFCEECMSYYRGDNEKEKY